MNEPQRRPKPKPPPVEIAPEPIPIPGGGLLTWKPPALSNPITITIPNVPSANGQRDLALNNSTDYLIRIGDYRHSGGIRFRGGRNVVVIGGRITLSGGGTPSDRTGLKLWPSGGSYYHVEGLEIRPDAADPSGLHDGIVLQGGTATPTTSASRIVIQNCRVGPTSIRIGESDAGGHSDFFQNQSEASPGYQGQICMDRVTALFDYNGIMLTAVSPTPLLDLRNVNMRKAEVNTSYRAHLGLYKVNAGTGLQNIVLSEFWVEPGQGYTFAGSFSPPPTTIATDAAGRTYGEWVGKNIAGRAYSGVPAGGDFCPAGTVGLGYVSPGYQ